jgi:hypothetical protein
VSARFRAKLSRVGAQSYPEGTQHRAPEDVFEPESLAGLDGLRVQLGHADGAPVLGRVVPGSVSHDRSHVVATLEITDGATVAGIRAGHIKEISLQYSCEIETDSAGHQHQRKIRFTGPSAHVALLDVRRERARCGATCSIAAQDGYMTTQRIADGGSIVFDAAAACGCRANADQAERDRIEAWLDHAVYATGVHKATLVTALGMRADAATRDVDRDMILETAAQLARPGSPATPASYHNGMRGRADAQRADINASDEAFRVVLQTKLTPRHDASSGAVAAAINARPALRALTGLARDHVVGVLEQVSSEDLERIADQMAAERAHVGATNAQLAGTRGDAAAVTLDDDAFRASLTSKLGSAAE